MLSLTTVYVIKGKNVMRMPASGPYNFAFQLLDMMFKKKSWASH